MSTVFMGGSRHISRLPADVRRRLDNVIANGLDVVVGDANGADKAFQQHLRDAHYNKVTVFCSGAAPRNNLGVWCTYHVDAPGRGFQFYAAKDREMARGADCGLMVWDGKSPGTMLNVLRLALAGKIAVLFNVAEGCVENVRNVDEFKRLIFQCSPEFRSDLKARATAEEWQSVEGAPQSNFLPSLDAFAARSAS
jgi:hypothetical protein